MVSSEINITLLRHGLSTANVAGIAQGQQDFPLHEDGINQAQALARYWETHEETFDLIISSPLARALETASIIAKPLGLNILEEPLWMERDFGDGEGLAYSEIEQHIRTTAGSWSNSKPLFPRSESEQDLMQRALEAIENLIKSNAQEILVVSHGGILNATMRLILSIPLPPDPIRPPSFRFNNTGFSKVTYQFDIPRWQIHLHNSTPHLEFTSEE